MSRSRSTAGHRELWVSGEDLEAFDAAIAEEIRVVAECQHGG